ncbi:MAG: shikimate dehydrogenase [Verrucomicrobiota bacterium]
MTPLLRPPPTARTRLLAVFGSPVRHSASPAMHNAALEELGLDWTYVACAVDSDHLKEALEGARRMGFAGVNLTVPHKQLAVPLMDVLHPSAREYGAVNTVVFEGEDAEGLWRPVGQLRDPSGPVRLHGYNTDADALVRALGEDLAIESRASRILLLGAGGAARAAALRLADEQVGELWLVNRSMEKAEALAREIAERSLVTDVRLGYPEGDVEVILNATSLGLKESDPLPLDISRFPLTQADGVYDMVYRPAETRLLRAAREAGCRTANGLGMLLYQGAAALELWTGRPSPVETMRRALKAEVYGATS